MVQRYRQKDKILFHIHIPKTAGVHLWNYLKTKNDSTYRSHRDNYHRFGSVFQAQGLLNNTFSFCVVRNPWSRLYSAYSFMVNGSERPDSIRTEYLKMNKVNSFSDYLKFIDDEYEINDLGNKKNNTNHRNTGDSLYHEPQYRWFMDVEGKNIILDKIYQMENLNPLYEKIDNFYGEEGAAVEYFNSKKSNVTKNKDDYRKHFNSREIDIVAKHYKKDIEILNYTFE